MSGSVGINADIVNRMTGVGPDATVSIRQYRWRFIKYTLLLCGVVVVVGDSGLAVPTSSWRGDGQGVAGGQFEHSAGGESFGFSLMGQAVIAAFTWTTTLESEGHNSAPFGEQGRGGGMKDFKCSDQSIAAGLLAFSARVAANREPV